MEIEHLYEFIVIAKQESFSRAAEELCISQSSLSKHILALERELGAPLLIRNPRNVAVSPAGAQVLPMAAEIYSLSNKIRVAADKESQKNKALLRIASIPVMAQYNITGTLARFQRNHPEVTLEVTECEQHDLAERLKNGSCELAFIRLGLDPEPGMEYAHFCKDHLVAVLDKNHPLANCAGLSLAQLRNQPLLFLDQRTGLFDLCSTLCSQAGFMPNIIYTGHRPENIVALAAQGMGIALLMRGHTDYIRSEAVVCLDILPKVESSICLMRSAGKPLSRFAKCFWQELEAIPSGNRPLEK